MHQHYVEPQRHLAARVVVNEGDRERLRAAARAAAAEIRRPLGL